ncbi:MAG: methyl-accepting chemotaxis protein [Burkholderiaceae bacterium]
MRINGPVTQREYEFLDQLLVSTTDATGRITHCNAAFCTVSGFDYEELIGQPHNMVRHPDMPEEAFKDMWATIGRGRPWTGMVKNRRKNGDHYWVRANVTPVMEQGRPVAYMSVREAATREDVRAAQALYEGIQAQRSTGSRRFRLHAGRVRRVGWRDLPGKLHRLNITQRLAFGLFGVAGLCLLTALLLPGLGLLAPALAGGAGAVALTLWFQFGIQQELDELERAANMIASCNLREPVRRLHPHPLSGITRALGQIQINLRAVIGDARVEVMGTVQTTAELARAGQDLSDRTETQAGAVQRSAATMEQIACTVRQTAGTAEQLAARSTSAAGAAQLGGTALEDLNTAFAAIEVSSRRIGDIVQVIEGIAFQTNILALNAAVEAARAGESGRGFAVVAAEVRSLAQRCAGAAKEVRAVIAESSGHVSQSARQIRDANAVMRRTVEEVGLVGRMMGEIQRATAEQAGGVADVNLAVSALDRMTQENSAMAEQTAASVEALHLRSDTLRRSLEVFRA